MERLTLPQGAGERIERLAAEFVASVPFPGIKRLIETGPSAVTSPCFQWAWRAYSELEGAPELDATRAQSLHAAAPWIRLLTQAAAARIDLVHGTHPRLLSCRRSRLGSRSGPNRSSRVTTTCA